MVLNDRLQHPISDPPFVAAKRCLSLLPRARGKGRLIQTNGGFRTRGGWIYGRCQYRKGSRRSISGGDYDRQAYNSLYKTWNPTGFDASSVDGHLPEKRNEDVHLDHQASRGFSLYDTKTRVKSRANWTAAGGPSVEPCDLAHSVIETPFRRDIVKEICECISSIHCQLTTTACNNVGG
jgi:hypothetical protein